MNTIAERPKTTLVRQQIAEQMAAAVKEGTPPWRQPWSSGVPMGVPCNFRSKRRYSGINVLLLMIQRRKSPHWGSANAWRRYTGAEIGAGQSPTNIIHCNRGTFRVFNAEQLFCPTDAVQKRVERYLKAEPRSVQPNFDPAEQLMQAVPVTVFCRGNRAVYHHPPEDYIEVPPRESFETLSDFYETLFHEWGHWAIHCIPWEKGGPDGYAFCELVVEIAACFVCAAIDIPHAATMLQASQSYVASWLKDMDNDPRYIFAAARHASRIADYLLAFRKEVV